MKFEWDPLKNQTNFDKHLVWFDEGETVWDDSGALVFYDPDHSDFEERFIAIGYSARLRLLVVIFHEREEDAVIRLISVRKATLKERRIYEERIRS